MVECVTFTSEQSMLANGVPVDVVPLTLTKYVALASVAGIRKGMRRLVPNTVLTLMGVAVAAAVPPQVSDNVIVTLAGGMVPPG